MDEPLTKKLKTENEPENDCALLDEILASLDATKFKQRDWIARRVNILISLNNVKN